MSTDAAPSSGTAHDSEPVFVEYQLNRRRWFSVAVVVSLVLLVIAVLYAVRLTVYSPEAVLRAHFQALTDRDAATALDTTTGEVADPDLLVPSVLESDDYLPPADMEVLEVTVDGREARARVGFTIGGRQQSAALQLRRGESRIDTLFQRWRITDATRPLPVGQAPGEIAVNGVTVFAHDLDGARSLPAFFGGYEVSAPADDPLWDDRAVTILVGPESSRQIDVPMVVRPEVREDAERQLAGILDECAARTDPQPAGCPFSNITVAEDTDVTWRIASYPSVTFDSGPDGEGGVAMLMRSTSDGEAIVSGVEEVFGIERPFETPVPFPVSGVVEVVDGAVVFTPTW